MSDPPPPPPPSHLPLLPSTTATTTTNTREFRKGNWTIQETLTLITAKKLDEERRSKSHHHDMPSSSTSSKPGELRWKWVENYCWSHGCFRSQNQCNDKWDNLLRDYKKVKECQSRSLLASYWTMDRQQRKSQNLPSNMSLEIFEALNEVVQRKQQKNASTQKAQQQQEHHQQFPVAAASPIPLTIRPALPEPVEVPPPAVSERSGSSGTESSDKPADADTKRRKVGNIDSSIMRSASLLAQAIQNCDEKKEKRHQELLECEQRRLQIEENRNEVKREGIANLVGAVTNLSSAIQSLLSDRT